MKLFLVRKETAVVITNASNREYAKRKAFKFFGGNPEMYLVVPLSDEGDICHFDFSMKP